MTNLLTVTGFERYYPEDAHEGVPHYRDSSGQDWYQLRYQFSKDTMKFCFDNQGFLLAFAPSAEFMFPMETITEIDIREWPPGVAANGFWRCGPSKIECRVENLGDRMMALAEWFTELAAQHKAIAMRLDDWRATDCYPLVPFPRFAKHIVNRAVEAGMSLQEYKLLSLEEAIE